MRRRDCEVTEGLQSSKEMAACPQAAGRAEHKCKRTADDNTVSNAKIIHIRPLPVKSARRALLCPVACRILVQRDETSTVLTGREMGHATLQKLKCKNSETAFGHFSH